MQPATSLSIRDRRVKATILFYTVYYAANNIIIITVCTSPGVMDGFTPTEFSNKRTDSGQ